MRRLTIISQALVPPAVSRWHRRVWSLALLLAMASSGCKHSPVQTGPAGTTAKTKTAVPPKPSANASPSSRLSDLPTASPTPPMVKPARVASGERIGVVRVIGAGQRFVLVQTPSSLGGRSLPDGQMLLSQGVGTATLRVSHERRPPFIAADVVAGEPRVGDDVYLASETYRPAASAPVAPSAGPAVSTSPSLFPAGPD